MSALRILVADDDPAVRDYYRTLLGELGYEVVDAVGTGTQLVERCEQVDPDLVITDIQMPDMEGIEAVIKLYEQRPRPVVLVSGVWDPKAFERAVKDQIVGYLVKPITADGIREQIDLVLRRFAEFQTISEETPQVRQALRDRRIVERAKSLLMQASHVSETEAFARLQEMAQQKHTKIATAAQLLVAAADAGK